MTRSLAACGQTLLLTLLLACGAGSPPEDLALAVEGDDAATLIPGGSLAFPVTLAGPASHPVTLSASGLPDGVTATFAPPTLEGETFRSTLTLTATREAVRGAVLVRVSATRAVDAAQSEATIALEVRGVSIRGVLLAQGQPAHADLRVHLGAETTSVGHDGVFTFTDAPLPYELVIEGDERLELFQGLTTPTPVLGTALGGRTIPRQSSVSVGLAEPLQAGESLVVCIDAPSATGCETATATRPPSYLIARWDGPATLEGTLRGLITRAEAGTAPTIVASIAQPVTLRSGITTVTATRLPAPAVEALPVTFTADYSLDSASIAAVTPDFGEVWNAFGAVTVRGDPALSTALNLPAATREGLVTASVRHAKDEAFDAFEVFAWAPFKERVPVSVALPEVPVVRGPAEDTTLSASDTFHVETTEGAVRRHSFRLSDWREITVTTTAPTLGFPDVAGIWPDARPEQVEEWEVQVLAGADAFERLMAGEPSFTVPLSTWTLRAPVYPTRAGVIFKLGRVWYAASP